MSSDKIVAMSQADSSAASGSTTQVSPPKMVELTLNFKTLTLDGLVDEGSRKILVSRSIVEEAEKLSLFTEYGVPCFPANVVTELREALRRKLGNLVFRRVARVITKPQDLFETVFHTYDVDRGDVATVYSAPDRAPAFTPDQIERNVEYKYRKFFAFTSEKALRDNDKYAGKSIFIASNKYSQIDFDSEDLSFSKSRLLRTNMVPPRERDLVCMLVGPSTHKRDSLEANFWFTCSEQFFRAWTLIMYDEHPSFENAGEEPHMREYYMSGNRLNTNNFLKFVIAHRASDVPIKQEEADARYYRLRTEYLSKKWCHYYSALVLMARYGEIPYHRNIPNNRGDGPHCVRWDLPSYFFSSTIHAFTTYDPKVHDITWQQVQDLPFASGKDMEMRIAFESRGCIPFIPSTHYPQQQRPTAPTKRPVLHCPVAQRPVVAPVRREKEERCGFEMKSHVEFPGLGSQSRDENVVRWMDMLDEKDEHQTVPLKKKPISQVYAPSGWAGIVARNQKLAASAKTSPPSKPTTPTASAKTSPSVKMDAPNPVKPFRLVNPIPTGMNWSDVTDDDTERNPWTEM